jgi:chromosomal replication initiation ATPase DnaA
MTHAERVQAAVLRLQSAERAYHEALSQVQTLALISAGRMAQPLPEAQVILDVVSAHYDIPVALILGHGRPAHLIEARTVALYLAANLTSHPPERLDRAFGLSRRATNNAVDRAQDWLQTSRKFADTVDLLTARCREQLHFAAVA